MLFTDPTEETRLYVGMLMERIQRDVANEVEMAVKREQRHAQRSINKDMDQMRHALETIRAEAATIENGGSWAAGIAALCLGTLLKRQSIDE